jgi:hypothetical protein
MKITNLSMTFLFKTYGGNILDKVSRLSDCVLLLGIAALAFAFAAEAIVEVESCEIVRCIVGT